MFVIAFGFGIARAFARAGDAGDAADGRPGRRAAEGDRPVLGDVDRRRSSSARPCRRVPLRRRSVGGLRSGRRSLIFLGWVVLSMQTFVRQPTAAATPTSGRPCTRAMEGLRFIRRTPVLLAAIALDLFAVLFGGAVALLPAIAEDRLGVGDIAYGWLRAAPGIGAAAMAVFLGGTTGPPPRRQDAAGRRRRVRRRHRRARGDPQLLRRVRRAGRAVGADMVSVFIRGSLVPLVTPDEKRGRVLAVENVFIGASNELGAFESGMAAQAFGTLGDGGRAAASGRWWSSASGGWRSRRCATSTASKSLEPAPTGAE